MRWLVRQGVVQPGEEFDDNEATAAEDEPVRAWCTKAAVLDRIAIGDNTGQLVARPEPEAKTEDVLSARP